MDTEDFEKFLQAYMVAAISEGNLCPPAHFAIEIFDLNDIKFGRVVNNAIFYNIQKVWPCRP